MAWCKGTARHSLVYVNALSLCAQAVQIGALPPLIALRLQTNGFSGTRIGLVAAAPWLAVVLLGRTVPFLLSRYGYARVNATGLAVSGFAVLIVLFSGDLWPILCANFFLGVGLILRWIACDSLIIALAPPALRGRAIAIHETLMGCGIAGGPLVLALFGSRGAIPLFACMGLLGIAAYALLAVRPVTGVPEDPQRLDHRPLPCLNGMGYAAFAAGFIETAGVSFVPVLGGTVALSAFAVGGIMLQLPIGYAADRLGVRPARRIAAMALAAAGIGCVLLQHRPLPLLISLFLLGGSAGSLYTLAVFAAGTSVAAELIAAGAARVALAYTLGSLIGPPTLGVLIALFGPSFLRN